MKESFWFVKKVSSFILPVASVSYCPHYNQKQFSLVNLDF